jgi:hypothetical protein
MGVCGSGLSIITEDRKFLDQQSDDQLLKVRVLWSQLREGQWVIWLLVALADASEFWGGYFLRLFWNFGTSYTVSFEDPVKECIWCRICYTGFEDDYSLLILSTGFSLSHIPRKSNLLKLRYTWKFLEELAEILILTARRIRNSNNVRAYGFSSYST